MRISLPSSTLDALIASLEESETADALLNEVFFALPSREVERDAKTGTSPANAFRKASLRKMNQEQKEAYASVQAGYGLDEFKEIDPAPYEANPYYELLKKARPAQKGKSEYRLASLEPYSLFVYDEVKTDPSNFHASYSPVGYFAKPFLFPSLDHEGRTWMSLIPHEINTMAPAIQKARGRVITYGAGLGYFAFMASEKEEVSEVAVLESDPAALSLFKECLLPLFPHKEKIHLISGNALKFSLKENEEPYDYLFVDIYHDAMDALPLYLGLRKKEGVAKDVDYWIEKAILAYFRRHVISYIVEQDDGVPDEAYKNPESFSDKVFSALHRYYGHGAIESEEELLRLLSDESLKDLASKIKI